MEVFDYRKQQWVAGGEAVILRIAQLETELRILAIDGRDYLDFSGKPKVLVTTAIAHAQKELDLLRPR